MARELREAEGHSQAFVADCLGLDRSTICRYEQSLRTPTGARGRAYLDYVAELLGESR